MNRKPPTLVLGPDGHPIVMEDEDVTHHLGKTFAIPGRRHSAKLFLPLHSVDLTIQHLAPLLREADPNLVVLTYRCGRREGIAQVTLGGILGVSRP